MTTYDNTDKGAVFPPSNNAKLILQGKVNNNGSEEYTAMVMSETKDGKRIIDIYQKVGTLFENDKSDNDNAPDYTGPLSGRRVAAWKKSKDDMKYMSLSISDKKEGAPQQAAQKLNDDIPF